MKDNDPAPLVLHESQGHVARLVLNSPANHNALSKAMIDALSKALDDIAASDARVVIIAARGKAFCAGHDLRELQAARQHPDQGQAAYQQLFDDCARMMQKLSALPQPVIAQVQGIATAAGCQLVASCDLAVAADSARFGVNGVNIGLFCSTPMVALTRAIPPRAAFEMLVTGAFIDAARAQELGLVNRVTPPESLAADTMALAQVIAAKLPAAVQMGKRAFHQQQDMPLADAYTATGKVICQNLMRADTAEGIQAFLEKRAPDWD